MPASGNDNNIFKDVEKDYRFLTGAGNVSETVQQFSICCGTEGGAPMGAPSARDDTNNPTNWVGDKRFLRY